MYATCANNEFDEEKQTSSAIEEKSLHNFLNT
jgi:hypothetical protein